MSPWSRKLRKIFQVEKFAEKTDILLTRMTLREVYDFDYPNPAAAVAAREAGG